MRFHRALHDGKPEACPSRAAGHERLEQPGPHVLRNARPVVGDPQRDGIVDPRTARQVLTRGLTRPHGDPGSRPGGLNGVEHQVGNHPVQQILVTLHGRHVPFEVDARIRRAVRVLAHEADGRGGDLMEIERAAFGHAHP